MKMFNNFVLALSLLQLASCGGGGAGGGSNNSSSSAATSQELSQVADVLTSRVAWQHKDIILIIHKGLTDTNDENLKALDSIVNITCSTVSCTVDKKGM